MGPVENKADKSESLPPPEDAIHQAGGGVSGEQRSVKTLNNVVLKHLQTLYNDHIDKNDKTWHADQVAAFLKHVQRDDEREIPKDLLEMPVFGLSDFLSYMTSSLTNIAAPPKEQDLSWPLSNYFISSSHNTYLTGNQLYSESSTDSYKNVLLRGCRCIEIDVWDGDESDSEGGTSASSSDDDEDDPKRYERRKARVETIKNKVPSSLIGKLEKTSLGKRLSKYVEKKTAAPVASESTATSAHATKEASSATNPTALSKTPSPQAAIVEPRVLHGYTLTKEVSFRDVCEVIRDNAFVASDLPLIVSLEVHCRAEQQEIMVKIIEDTWKGLLVTSPEEDAKSLPAPGDLRHKILVKVKYAPNDAAHTATTDSTAAKLETPSTQGSEEDTTPPGTATDPKGKKKKRPSKVIEALSKLGIYTRGVSFKSLTQPEASMPTHVFSLSEKGVMEVHQKSARQLFDHNRHFLMRAYPSGLRISSSNLDPAVFWRKGIQIVALNWQRWDQGMMLNEGMFAGTGGYVLKPEGYRSTTPDRDPTATTTQATIPHHTLDLTIQVLAGQSLPLPEGEPDPAKFHPYVKVELHVEEPEERATRVAGTASNEQVTREKEGEYKARTKTRKGRDPEFGDALGFGKVAGVVPELAFVRFTVRDDDIGRDDLAAWACVRVDRLREGYRFVHLLDAKGVETEGVLLVKVTKRVV
ncbi:PLC-like phosphodiesterase [Coniochaeta sp. PMI_546]|nr:PLC-like phosphodiesterase [Coniochaeta sp. PMI_546]